VVTDIPLAINVATAAAPVPLGVAQPPAIFTAPVLQVVVPSVPSRAAKVTRILSTDV